MKCPACARPLRGESEACPACGALSRPPVEGALAQDPALRREPAGKRRRERERERRWQDEVRERVDRRRQRAPPGEASELPLFRQSEAEAPAAPAPVQPVVPAPRSVPVPGPAAEPPSPVGPTELGLEPEAPAPVDDVELLLRPAGGAAEAGPAQSLELQPAETAPAASASIDLREDEASAEGMDHWALGESSRGPSAALVDRPAQAAERLQAALVDLGVLAALWAGLLYGAGRAARVPLGGLQPAWPWLVGYMALLGLLYAAYFTGTTGQTLGKMLFGLRVVTRDGGVPGYAAALGRAALGALGAALAGVGLAPMLFDPARRALHDRVFGTRVVRPSPPTARLS